MTDFHPPKRADILADPNWFPATLDLHNGTVGFVRTARAALAEQSFLDERWRDRPTALQWVAFREVAPEQTSPRLNFIWHTAFCSSTAISRLLDVQGKNIGLREPEALTLLADRKRAGAGAIPTEMARALLALFARRFDAHEAITIKPSNMANYLLPEAAALSSGRWLMLYSDCASFLAAVVRRGEPRRAHVRRAFEKVAGDNVRDRRWPIENYFAFTDLQIAAFCGQLQIAELRRAMATLPEGRAMSLDCDAFLRDHERTIGAIDRFFALEIGSPRIAEAVSGKLMTSDAKTPEQSFDVGERRAEWDRLPSGIKHEIGATVTWAADLFGVKSGDPPLPLPLVPLDKDYARR